MDLLKGQNKTNNDDLNELLKEAGEKSENNGRKYDMLNEKYAEIQTLIAKRDECFEHPELQNSKQLTYLVYKIPVRSGSSNQRVYEQLSEVCAHAGLNNREEYLAKDTLLKVVVLPKFVTDVNTADVEIIKILPEVLTDELKEHMERNVILIQDYIKKLRYE
ncbi:MAG: hypothetical protein WC979_01215 [Candidatus Pacearchaeota archaeon]|jgi:hypothetical protein|nr:hypothetical protein [Clostridia bacterium]